MTETNILFICKYNVFRSKVAEAYFKKINKNKNIKVKSAGLILGCKKNYKIIEICKKLGLKLKIKSEGLNICLIKLADIIIIVANDVPKEIFKYNKKYPKKVILWEIKDMSDTEKDVDLKREITIKQIMKKVDELNKQLERGKLK
jgi:protein-tyrosine-phosphatase